MSTPLVIVEGFLSSHKVFAWSQFESYLNSNTEERQVLFASVGPVSSLHDRACELYYELVGGTVEYGDEHSKRSGHDRYGRSYPNGLYPGWSRTRPLHFLGHSIGGLTIVKLQSLIKDGFFGDGLHTDMILSVNTISSPFRGTQLVYTLGERTDAAPAVRWLSVGSLIAKIIHIISYISPLLPPFFDLHTESRRLSYRDISFMSLVQQLIKSDWAEGHDAAPFDVTFQAADEREGSGEGIAYDGTFYRSHVARMAHIDRLSFWNPLSFTSRAISTFDFSTLSPAPSFFPRTEILRATPPVSRVQVDDASERGLLDPVPITKNELIGEECFANDGVVPVFSQWHPFACSSTKCRHYSGLSSGQLKTSHPVEMQMNALPQSGIWHVHQLDDAHHNSLAPFWYGTKHQKHFWQEFGVWLRTIDTQRVCGS